MRQKQRGQHVNMTGTKQYKYAPLVLLAGDREMCIFSAATDGACCHLAK